MELTITESKLLLKMQVNKCANKANALIKSGFGYAKRIGEQFGQSYRVVDTCGLMNDIEFTGYQYTVISCVTDTTQLVYN